MHSTTSLLDFYNFYDNMLRKGALAHALWFLGGEH